MFGLISLLSIKDFFFDFDKTCVFQVIVYITVVRYYINTIKTTFDSNFHLYQASKQYRYT